MNAKHTPGPWRVLYVLDTNRTEDRHRVTVCTPYKYTKPEHTPEQHVADCGRSDDQTALANARLIAAAPDLLYALRGIVNGTSPNWLDIARAAIAKAEGSPDATL
jgi:hypothetical protein